MDKRHNTLASRLCEGDPDLTCPEHDAMSFALGDEATWDRILDDSGLKSLMASERPLPAGSNGYRLGQVRLEYPIKKGAGQYEVIIGFADAMRPVIIVEFDVAIGKAIEHARGAIFVEAKPKLKNPMEALRQINVYRNFIRNIDALRKSEFLLWCPTIDEKSRTVFSSQGIFVSAAKIQE